MRRRSTPGSVSKSNPLALSPPQGSFETEELRERAGGRTEIGGTRCALISTPSYCLPKPPNRNKAHQSNWASRANNSRLPAF